MRTPSITQTPEQAQDAGAVSGVPANGPRRVHRTAAQCVAAAERAAVIGARGKRRPRVKVYLTDGEWAVVQARARAVGQMHGRYVREVAVGVVPKARPGQANAEAVRELARVGNNLNQLAHAANASGRLPDAERLDAVLNDLLEVVRRIG